MEISAMSLDQLCKHLSNPNLDKREDTVSLICESGQKLYSSRHLNPGWMCAGIYKWLVGDTQKESACGTYNALWRLRCKQCDTPQKFTLGELAMFAKRVLLQVDA